MLANTQALIEKIQTLPPDRLVEVEDFVYSAAAGSCDPGPVKRSRSRSNAR
jgi:hypothetical protein